MVTKDFTAKEKLLSLKESGLKRKLVGLEMIDKGIPRHGYEIMDESGRPIGVVTSGTQSPSLQKAIAIGYVNTEFSGLDTLVKIKVRDKLLSAKVAKMPFQ